MQNCLGKLPVGTLWQRAALQMSIGIFSVLLAVEMIYVYWYTVQGSWGIEGEGHGLLLAVIRL